MVDAFQLMVHQFYLASVPYPDQQAQDQQGEDHTKDGEEKVLRFEIHRVHCIRPDESGALRRMITNFGHGQRLDT